MDNKAGLFMKKIAVFTGTRAEYGLLYWILKELDEASNVELQLLVGGMHLSHEFGYTVEEIEKDGFTILERLEFLVSSDTPVGISKSIGLAIISVAESFSRLKPDLVVLLGDRFESMAIAQAAMIAGIPIAHIHGGELTQALIDDSVRHSITKMALLHFTSTEVYRKRVIQMGEQPKYVFNVGAPGIDNINQLILMNKSELSQSLNFSLNSDFFLVTYHPVTLVTDGAIAALENLLSALEEFPQHKIIITYPNADTYGRNLIGALVKFAERFPERVLLMQSMGQIRYLSAMKYASVVIGNSSSGIIETPSFKVPTVNIGNRQKGRESSPSVIHCNESYDAIKKAIYKATSDDFSLKIKGFENPYGKGGASKRIADILVDETIQADIQKVFYDLD